MRKNRFPRIIKMRLDSLEFVGMQVAARIRRMMAARPSQFLRYPSPIMLALCYAERSYDTPSVSLIPSPLQLGRQSLSAQRALNFAQISSV